MTRGSGHRAHLPVLVRRERIPPARFVQRVDRLAIGVVPGAGRGSSRTTSARPPRSAVLPRGSRNGPPRRSSRSDRQGGHAGLRSSPGQLAVGVAQGIRATDFVRSELAHAQDRAVAVGIPVIAVVVVDQRDAGRIGAPDRFGVVHRQVGPGLQVAAEIEGGVEVAGNILGAAGEQPVCVVGAHAAQAAGVGDGVGSVVVDQPIGSVVLAVELLAGACRRCRALAVGRVDQCRPEVGRKPTLRCSMFQEGYGASSASSICGRSRPNSGSRLVYCSA